MANEMPHAEAYTGLSRKVLQYSESFLRIVDKIKRPGFAEADWAQLEELVDVKSLSASGCLPDRSRGDFELAAIQAADRSVWRHDQLGRDLATDHRGAGPGISRAGRAQHRATA